MEENQKIQFKEELEAIHAVYSKDKPTKPVLRHWWNALARYPLEVVLKCLDEHVKKSKFAPKPADIVEMVANTDGRPSADEAWATALKSSDESVTLVWSDEIAQALTGGASDLLVEGDKMAARLAFRASYERLVQEARDNLTPINWQVTLGHDVDNRNDVIEQAAISGRISQDRASTLLLEKPTEQGKALLALMHESKEADPEVIKTELEKIRAMTG